MSFLFGQCETQRCSSLLLLVYSDVSMLATFCLTTQRLNFIGELDILRRPTLPNTLSSVLLISKVPLGYKVPMLNFGFGKGILNGLNLDTTRCQIQYSSLVNSQGSTLEQTSLTGSGASVTVTADTFLQASCNTSTYHEFLNGFSNMIKYIDASASIIANSQTTFDMVNLVLPHLESCDLPQIRHLSLLFLKLGKTASLSALITMT